jgi:hypothetical protein
MDQSLETQGEVALTSIAPEIVNVSCAAPDRTEACGSIVFNPATRALEIAPAYRDKAAKAVMRELRRTKLRLYFTFARLYCLKFALQSRSAAAAFFVAGDRQGCPRSAWTRVLKLA